MTAPALVLDDVGKRYGASDAVRAVTLDLRAGEVMALLGPNGAGKTTLMKMILGLTRPTEGAITVLGGAPGAAEARRQSGYLPESVAFNPALTGRETLRFFARLKGRDRAEVEHLLGRVGLAEAAHRRVGTYSKGMRQRLGLAQALLGEPRLLLLDEPTSGLDPILRRAFYEIIAELKARGTSILLSSHVLTELEARTDRAAILRDGRLVALDSLADLRRAAGLPVRIRVEGRPATLEAMTRDFGARPMNGHAVELFCPAERKIETLRRIADLPVEIDDLELVPPSLDEVYAHYGAPTARTPGDGR
ncbi:MAG: ABC transporter ATP-binding protein [Geminicoccaceae bacterium]|nr:ABC transporter ATP-binding protein [Geminicoccaceae bacterium]